MDASETEFRAWRWRLNITSQAEAARMIGRSRRQIASYEAGAQIPRVVRLAMMALEMIERWHQGGWTADGDRLLMEQADKLEAMR